MQQLLLVGAGGAIGSVLRFWLGGVVAQQAGRDFPWGTLSVNVLGSLAIGVLYVLFTERMTQAADLRLFLMTGLLGGFTTFSAFSLETLSLLHDGAVLRAALNIVVSVSSCLLAAWVGVLLGRSF
jgi:CrcB protein